MNRLLIIPLILLDVLAALLLALGAAAYFGPTIDVLRSIADQKLALPMMVVGALLMAICGPLMIRLFIASMRERGR